MLDQLIVATVLALGISLRLLDFFYSPSIHPWILGFPTARPLARSERKSDVPDTSVLTYDDRWTEAGDVIFKTSRSVRLIHTHIRTSEASGSKALAHMASSGTMTLTGANVMPDLGTVGTVNSYLPNPDGGGT